MKSHKQNIGHLAGTQLEKRTVTVKGTKHLHREKEDDQKEPPMSQTTTARTEKKIRKMEEEEKGTVGSAISL